MKIISKIIGIILCITIFFSFNSTLCKAKIFENKINNRKIQNIAVLVYNFQDLYIQELMNSFNKIQKDNPNAVKFSFIDGQGNIAKQIENIDSIVRKNFDLIIAIIGSQRPEILKDIILKVKPSNIPIMIVELNNEIVEELHNYYNKAIFVTTNSAESGRIQGNMISDLWNNKRNIIDKNNDGKLQYILLGGNRDSPIAQKRTKNVIETMNNSGIQTEELQLISAYWSKELAEEYVEKLLPQYGKKVEAIISNNDEMAIGAIEALQKYGYNLEGGNKFIPVFGIDGLDKSKDLIEKEIMEGTVTTNPQTFADGFYKIGMNLINGLNPTENTDYKYIKGQIVIPNAYKEYTKGNKAN